MDNNQMEEKCSGVVKFFSFIGCIITLGIVLGTTIFFWKSSLNSLQNREECAILLS